MFSSQRNDKCLRKYIFILKFEHYTLDTYIKASYDSSETYTVFMSRNKIDLMVSFKLKKTGQQTI
jgi:hypothetical protein